MTFLHWLASLFRRHKKGYRLEIPIGFEKKRKRLALFGESNRSNKGG